MTGLGKVRQIQCGHLGDIHVEAIRHISAVNLLFYRSGAASLIVYTFSVDIISERFSSFDFFDLHFD